MNISNTQSINTEEIYKYWATNMISGWFIWLHVGKSTTGPVSIDQCHLHTFVVIFKTQHITLQMQQMLQQTVASSKFLANIMMQQIVNKNLAGLTYIPMTLHISIVWHTQF